MSDPSLAYRADRDAFGHMLMDYYLNPQDEIFEIIEREDGYLDASSHAGVYFTSFADFANCEKEGLGCLLPGATLDVGCGAGRAELYLQEKGWPVTGIDISPLAVEVCKRRGVRDVHTRSITQVGPALGVFDNILMFGNNWGLMGNFHRARWLLHRFHRITAPRARIVAFSMDIYRTDNPLHLAYQAWNRERGRMSGQIRMRVRHQVYLSRWFDYLMVSKEEMQSILSGTGWKVDHFIQQDEPRYAAIIDKE